MQPEAGATMPTILILNGPNLNLLGTREPEIYGSDTLDELMDGLGRRAVELGCVIETAQSNAEGALVDRIQQAGREGVDFILFNPGAYTHTSIALRDALLGVAVPFIEVHLSNVFAREEFRQASYLSDIAVGVISGLGAQGYELALEAAAARLARKG